MSNKPIDLELKVSKGRSYGRQAMWDKMREMREFTIQDIASHSNRDTSSTNEYIRSLIAAGIVKELGVVPSPKSTSKRHQRFLFQLVKDQGYEAPRLRADGSVVVEAKDYMWRTMKMIGCFNYVELALHASTDECKVSQVDARSYCMHLAKAGYLAIVKKHTTKSLTVYRLLPSMNTGPYAPKIQRTKCVFDSNLNQIMWHRPLD